jgi:uncharacterized membrane protein
MHALLVFSAFSLFLGALLSNWAYWATEQVQWTNFASWLTAGGLVFAALAMAWALVEQLLRRGSRRSSPLYLIVLGVCCLVALVNSLVLAKDGWAAMPAALWLSAVVMLLITFVAVLGVTSLRARITS